MKISTQVLACVALLCGVASVRANTVYVSKTSTPADPYGSWDAAANDLATALGACAEGGEIIVDDGVYTNAAALSISKGITVRSRNGADKTTLFFAQAVNFLTINAAGAKIQGLTLASDYTKRTGLQIMSLTSGTVDGCVIRDFWGDNSPMMTVYSSGVVTNSVITHNYVSSNDRIISARGGKFYDTKIVSNENYNSSWPCAIDLNAGGSLFRNCLIAKNISNGSIYILRSSGNSATFENCTIADNEIKGSATTAALSISANVVFKNCIIHNNRNSAGVANFTGSTDGISYTATDPVPGDATKHNVRSTADTLGADYAPGMGLWVDGGAALDWCARAKDLAGRDRVSGSAVDLGCYEYVQDGSIKCSATPSVTSGLGAQDVAIDAYTVGTNKTNLTYSYVVKDSDGKAVFSASDVSSASVTNRFGQGSYEITITVKNGAGESDTWTGTERFSILPDTVYVSHDPTATPTAPYGTWKTAARDIATALDTCSDGMTVIVDDGVYTNDTGLTLSKEISLKSRNGADKTTIYTQKAITLLTLNHAKARAENVTLASDYTSRAVKPLTISSGTFAGGTVRDFWGNNTPLITVSSSGVITNSVVTHNYMSANDRIMLVSGGTFHDVRFVGNENSNDNYPCLMQLNGNGAVFRDCLIVCNTNHGSCYSVLKSNSKSVTFENCTIADNYVAGSDAQAALELNANITFKNCIIHNNANRSAVLNYTGSTAGITYSATAPKPGDDEAHNVLSTDGMFGPGYALNVGKWIDGGTELAWHDGAKDLAGNDRVQGSAVDMGCFEAEPVPFSCSISLESDKRLGPGPIVLSAVVLGAGGGDIDYRWTVTNQFGEVAASQTIRNSAVFTNDYAVGSYSVKLEVTNGGQTVSSEKADAFKVYPPLVRVNMTAKTAYPYDTDQNAFNDISEAVSFALDGMRVLVADGVYTNAANVILSKNVTVESEHGADRTFVFSNLPNTSWQLYKDGSVVRGLTLFSDLVCRKDQHAVSMSAGLMESCVITNFGAYYTTVLSMSGSSVLSNCTVTCNRSDYRAHFSEMYDNAKIIDCRFVDNKSTGGPYSSILHAVGSGQIRDSVFAGNTMSGVNEAEQFGTVLRAQGGSLVNCTIADNICSDSTTNAAVSGTATLSNCILWNNPTKNGECSVRGSVTCDHCLGADDSVAGTGCLVGDPRFFRSARRDYRLKQSSPAIDAGDTNLWNGASLDAALDVRGKPRLRGENIDIGACEWQHAGFLLLVR